MIKDGEPAVSHDRDNQGTSYVRVRGEIDVSNVDRLASTLDSALRDHPHRIVIDLSGATFMDGAAVSQIIRIREALPADRGSIILLHPKPIVLKLLAVLGLEDLCVVEGQVEGQSGGRDIA